MANPAEKLAHSPLGASSMYRWSKCPGSNKLCANIPDHTSSYAQEGTAAHEIAAQWLKTGSPPKNMDDELAEGLGFYVDAVKDDYEGSGREGAKGTLLVEHAFDLGGVFPGCYGTADAVVWNPVSRILHVHDLKWGAGIPVEVVDNPQLKYYALGALVTLGLPAKEVEMVICQPRCPHRDGPIRRWKISSTALIDFSADLIEFAKATLKAGAPLVAGEHCRFCKASATCPALHSKATSLAKLEFSPATPEYNPVELATAMEWAGKMEAWAKNVREFAYGEAKHGRPPPGWKLVDKRATRKWLDNVDENTLALATGLEPKEFLGEPKLLSPAQAEKLLPKSDKAALKIYITSESSGTKLVPEHEPGEPIKLDPASEFTKIS